MIEPKVPSGFPAAITIGELYGPAMEIRDQEEADLYLSRLLGHAAEQWPEIDAAEREKNVKTSLGYYAGYYTCETRERVERLFRCTHPVFGSIAENGSPTADEAYRMGLEAGKKARDRRR